VVVVAVVVVQFFRLQSRVPTTTVVTVQFSLAISGSLSLLPKRLFRHVTISRDQQLGNSRTAAIPTKAHSRRLAFELLSGSDNRHQNNGLFPMYLLIKMYLLSPACLI